MRLKKQVDFKAWSSSVWTYNKKEGQTFVMQNFPEPNLFLITTNSSMGAVKYAKIVPVFQPSMQNIVDQIALPNFRVGIVTVQIIKLQQM